MRILRYGLAILALCQTGQAWAKSASDYFPICTAPMAVTGKTLTVDPSARGAGSLPTIDAAMKAARPGDVISLMTGDYGELKIAGANQGRFITITAASGQTPKFTRVYVKGSHWRLTGLTVSSFSNDGFYPNGTAIRKPLVTIGDSDNVIFEHNIVQSQAGRYDWQPVVPRIASPTAVSQGISATQSSCVSIVDNRIANIWDGIAIGGDQAGNHGKYSLVSGNAIDNFAGDGIDHFGSHIRIENNRITNGHGVCNNICVHNDGIQGWNWNNRTDLLNTDVIINNNEIVVRADPNLVLPADAFQGITIFNGNWDGVQIINNAIIANAYHGITVFGARNVSIMNNTVAPADPKRGTWITYSPGKDLQQASFNKVVIRNNVAREVTLYKREPVEGAIVDHNLNIKSAEDFSEVFVKFDLANSVFDLHPSKRSDARGEGSADGAPTTDIEGRPRKMPMDIGAYAYNGN